MLWIGVAISNALALAVLERDDVEVTVTKTLLRNSCLLVIADVTLVVAKSLNHELK